MGSEPADAWRRHCRQLERRARQLRDPVAVARQHHQRGWVLSHLLDDPASAIRAWAAALEAWPTHVPSLVALRDAALATDDADLARRVFDNHLDGLNRPGADVRDAAEMHTFFAWAWLLRWPDGPRAASAVRRLDAVAPDGDGDVLAPLALPRTGQVLRLERRIEAGHRRDMLRALADLRTSGTRPGEVDVLPLLAEAAETDPYAATRWVEEATLRDDPRAQAEGLEALAAHCGAYAPALRFLAGELWELVLDDARRAGAAFEAASDVALDQVMLVKQAIRRTRARNEPAALGEVLEDLAARVDEDAVFAATLTLRAAALFAEANDTTRAWPLALRALDALPRLPAARALVAQLGVADQRWRALAEALSVADHGDWRRLRAAVLEHAVGDLAGAEAALGLTDDSTDLAELRMRQRLLGLAGDAGVSRAQQREAAILEAGERRADLYLRIANGYAAADNHDKAVTYLFWVLDHDPEHLTALRLLFDSCRRGRRRAHLLDAAGRLLALLEDPEDRLPVQREMARGMSDADPPRAASVLEQALVTNPADPETLADLEGLYIRLEDFDALVAAYRRVLRYPGTESSARAAVGLRLGRLLEGPVADAGAALRVYTDALELAGGAPAVEAALRAGVARMAGGEEPTATVHGSQSSTHGGTSIESAIDGAVDALDALVEHEGLAEDDAHTAVDAAPELPRLGPLPPMQRPGAEADDGGAGLLAPLLPDDDDEPVTLTDALELPAVNAPPATLHFLGDERARTREEDPGRAVIARKLRRGRNQGDWPEGGDTALAGHIAAFRAADDPDLRFEAALAMGGRYAELGRWPEATRALKAARGYRADDPRVEKLLEDAFAAQDDWPGLVDLLTVRLRRTRDPNRKQALLVRTARLRVNALDDPTGAVEAYREAVQIGPVDPAVLAELANALKNLRQWKEYVAVLTDAGRAEPDTVSAQDALTLGRVFLYRLDDPERAAPYILRAARALPGRVDVAADLAQARAAAGDVRQGVRLLEQAIAAAAGPEGRQPRRVLRLRLARLYEDHAGDTELARRTYREALRDGVRDPAVLERVERLAVEARDWVTLGEVLRRALEDARARSDREDIRKTGVRLGKLLRDRLDAPREAAEVLLETYEQVPEDLALFKVAEQSVAAQPEPGFIIRLYGTWVQHTPLDPPERLQAGLRLVQAYEAEARVDEAVDELEVLRGIDPTHAEVRANIERMYQRAGRWPVLVEMYRDDLQWADDDRRQSIRRRLARALEVGMRELPAATEAWRAVLAEAPKDLEAVRAVARLLEAQKRWGELLMISQREVALVEHPRQKAYIHFRIGSLHETHMGELEAAAAAYRTALKLDPRCFPALHGLRTIASDLGDWAQVLELLRRELKLWDQPKEQAAVLARMGDVFTAHVHTDGAAEDALNCYRRAVAAWPACVPAARALANAAFAAGRHAEAAPLLQTLTQQKLDGWPKSERSDLFYKRGVVALALGRTLEAIESLELALEFDPEHLEALQALVKAIGRTGDQERLDGLTRRLDAAYREHTTAGRVIESARVEVLRGSVAEHRLDLDAAISHYRHAAELRARDLGAHRPLVMLYVRARRWSDATRALRSFAERLRPTVVEDPQVRARYVEALLLEAEIWTDGAVDPGRAIICCQTVLRVEPNSRKAMYRMAQAHFLKKEYAEAREVMHRVLPQPGETLDATRYAHFVFYLGRIHALGLEDERRALELYQRALQIDPQCAAALLAQLALLAKNGRDAAIGRLLAAHQPLIAGDDAGDPVIGALKIHVATGLAHRGDTAQACRLLGPLAAGAGPRARDARFALVRVHQLRGAVDDAAKPLFRILDENVCDTEALQNLASLLNEHGNDERLYQVLSALELFGGLGPDEQARFDELGARARRAGDRGIRPLSTADLQRHVAHPSFHSPLVKLVGLCEPALSIRFPVRSPEPTRADAVGARHPFWPEVRAIHQLFGWRKFELFLTDDVELARVEPGDKVCVVLGGLGEQTLTSAHRRFLLARAALMGREGLARLHDLGVERALEVLAVLGKLFAPRPATEPLARTVLDALPPKVQGTVQAMVESIGRAGLPTSLTGEAALSGITRTADRAGLLAGGRLREAVESILLADPALGGVLPVRGDLTWAVRTESRLQDLVKYALSESFHQVRRAVGLSIQGAPG